MNSGCFWDELLLDIWQEIIFLLFQNTWQEFFTAPRGFGAKKKQPAGCLQKTLRELDCDRLLLAGQVFKGELALGSILLVFPGTKAFEQGLVFSR